MTIDDIRDAKMTGSAFTIRTNDGQTYRVPHEDYVLIPPRDRAAYCIVYPEKEGARGVFVAYQNIAAIEFDDAKNMSAQP